MVFHHDFVTLPKLEQITNPDGKRVYKISEGCYYPSVTTMLAQSKDNPELEAWKNRIGGIEAERESNLARSRGSAVHSLVEQHLRNNPPNQFSMMPDVKLLYRGLIPILSRIDNIRILEGTLYSHELELAGTTDCMADFDYESSIIDFKTSKEEKSMDSPSIENYFLQGTAYGMMFEELYHTKVENVVIIITNLKGTVQVFQTKKSEHINKLRARIAQYKERILHA